MSMVNRNGILPGPGLWQFFPTITKYAEMPVQAVPGREKTRREGV